MLLSIQTSRTSRVRKHQLSTSGDQPHKGQKRQLLLSWPLYHLIKKDQSPEPTHIAKQLSTMKLIQDLDILKSSSLSDYLIAPTKYHIKPRPSPYDADVDNDNEDDPSMFDLHLLLQELTPNKEETPPLFKEAGPCPHTPKESVVSSMGELPPVLKLKPRPKRKMHCPIKHKRTDAPSFPILGSSKCER